MMLSLLVALAAGQLLPKDPPVRPRVFRSDGAERLTRLGGGDDLAFFEAFPASGAGTSGACSTTAPTGAKGEALTFTRASTATCTKTATGGLATTGIANGDLVTLSSNVARVEYDSNGTLGLLVESSRTNSALRSQEFNDAAWAKINSVSVAPVVTTDFAVAPDGTTTAERVQFADCPSAGNYSLIQGAGATSQSGSVSVYVKGNGTSGNVGVSVSSTGGPNAGISCAFNATTWTRCVVPHTGAGVALNSINIGCGNGVVNLSSTGASDVLLWGGQSEAGAYATSYIPTTTVAVTRSAETNSFAFTSIPIGSSLSSAISMYSAQAPASGNGIMQVGPGGGYQTMSISGANPACFDAFTSLLAVVAVTAGQHRVSCSTARSIFYDATTNTAAQQLTGGAVSTANIGYTSAGNPPFDGIVSRVCIDPSPTRCR